MKKYIILIILFLPSVVHSATWQSFYNFNASGTWWETCGIEVPFNTSPRVSVSRAGGAPQDSSVWVATSSAEMTRACRDGSGNNVGANSIGWSTTGYAYKIQWQSNLIMNFLYSTDYDPCSDGIQNGDETGVDCGGSCPNTCEPAECSDGILSGDEIGIDCEGSCAAPCENLCPSGYSYNQDVSQCEYIIGSDAFGNCPSGYDQYYELQPDNTWQEAGCVHYQDDVYAAAGTSTSFSSPPDGFASVVNSYNSTTISSTVDNGDGTSTVVETSTVINNEGDTYNQSTTNQTTTKIVDNATGEVLSSDTQTQSTSSYVDNVNNYNWQINVDQSGVNGDLPAGVIPAEGDLNNVLDSYLNSATIDSITGSNGIIGGSGIETSSSVCSIDTILFGTTVTIDFCNTDVTDKLTLLGSLLVSITYLAAVFLVFARS